VVVEDASTSWRCCCCSALVCSTARGRRSALPQWWC